jgi:hypothetical protein
LPGRQRKLRIFVAFKTHFDIGFTGLVNEVLDSYTTVMVPRALEACRRTMENQPGHRYIWTLPAWPLAYCLRALKGSALGRELEQRVQEGMVVWHALPFTTHTELLGLEDLIRGLYVGRSLGTRFRRESVAAKMTDVPGHTWILPTLLAAAGVKFLHLGCNPCSTPPNVPFLFRWEGPDGSQVMTMYSRGGYGTQLLPPPGWKLPVWLALQHTSDNASPQRAEAVQEILHSVHERSPGTEVIFGTLDDFARALEELNPDLPVVRKDLADSWIHGVGTFPAQVSTLRDLRCRLVQDESALAMRRLSRIGGAGRPGSRTERDASASSIAAAYEKILLFGEHTWGMDTKLALNPAEFGGRIYDKEAFETVRQSGKYERIQRSWSDKGRLVEEALGHLKDLEASLTGREPGAKVALPATYDVVNHHLWEWSGPLRLGSFSGSVRAVKEADGSELKVTVIDEETWVTVQGLAPLSSVRLHVEKAGKGQVQKMKPQAARFIARARASGNRLVMENGRVRITVDKTRSGVTSMIDLETGRDWVDRKAAVPFGAYRYDVYSRREIVDYLKSYAYDLQPWFLDDFGKPGYPDGPHQTFTGNLISTTRESGTGWTRLRLLWQQDPESVRTLGNASKVSQSITIFDGQPWVDLEYSLTGKEACPLLEAGHVVLPFLCDRPRYAINKTGSVVDPASDIEIDANRLLFCCERWVDVRDGRGGVLVIPRDTPVFSIGSPAIARFDGSAVPGGSTLYFNLFNTQWGTNFPQWIGGDFRFRFRLVPHAGDWRAARAWELAAAALQPPSCLPVHPTASAGPAWGLLRNPVPGLETVTLKTAEDGSGVILRLREPTGRGGRRTLRFRLPAAGPAPKLFACTLLEDELEALSTARSRDTASVTLTVRPFEVITLKLKI